MAEEADRGFRLGPFTGGLNTASDETSVQDTDLVICDNFELDLDGALTTRPPIVDTTSTWPGSGTMFIRGFFVSTSGAKYLIAADNNTSTYFYNGTAWVLITATVAAAAVAQYRDKLWMTAAPTSVQNGGSWDPSTGFTARTGMPRGRTIAVNKERLWIGGGSDALVNGARLYYSAVAAPNEWPNTTPSGGGFVDVSAGDGQNIVEVVIYYADILIFKNHSVYRFSFSSAPEGGEVTRLSSTIGVAAEGCVVVHENTTYVLYKDSVYELVNYNFNLINIKVPFTPTSPLGVLRPFGLAVWANRLLVTYYDNTYVYSLRTGTWGTWSSSALGTLGPFFQMPPTQGDVDVAFTTSGKGAANKLYRIADEITSAREVMIARMRTKNYDYQSSHAFKRLMWWGADVIAKAPVAAHVVPIVFNQSTTHGQMKAFTHAQLSAYQHGRMLAGSLEIIDPVPLEGSAADRKFLKFLKSLRFRQIYYEIRFETDGSVLTAPAKLFTLTTFVLSKQIVSRKVN